MAFKGMKVTVERAGNTVKWVNVNGVALEAGQIEELDTTDNLVGVLTGAIGIGETGDMAIDNVAVRLNKETAGDAFTAGQRCEIKFQSNGVVDCDPNVAGSHICLEAAPADITTVLVSINKLAG